MYRIGSICLKFAHTVTDSNPICLCNRHIVILIIITPQYTQSGFFNSPEDITHTIHPHMNKILLRNFPGAFLLPLCRSRFFVHKLAGIIYVDNNIIFNEFLHEYRLVCMRNVSFWIGSITLITLCVRLLQRAEYMKKKMQVLYIIMSTLCWF